MYNRAESPEDPWLSPQDHEDSIAAYDMLYGEDSYTENAEVLSIHNGANVFIKIYNNDVCNFDSSTDYEEEEVEEEEVEEEEE
jgi:hypothetical protein